MKKKSKKKWIIITVVLLIVIGLIMYGCLNSRGGAGYTEETAEIRDIVTFYSYSGNVDAKNKQNVISVGSNLSLDMIYVKAGDYVQVDDVLYSLDSLDAENNVAAAAANVEIARINYEKARGVGKDQSIMQAKTALSSATITFNDAEINLERMQELFESEGISQAELEKAQTSYNNAKTQLESAQFNYDAAETQADQGVQSAKAQYDQAQANYNNALNAVENRKIKAEVEGTVSDVYAQENTTLGMGEKVMDIIDYNSLILEIRIDEYEMSAVSEGKEVDVFINALEKTITGTITNI
ncbi:MAG: HlyD family efflux transporter periplasmic adaptor subunit, partial [Clostridiales bacterium]|nr:HlyD family efflux transporter periplasmic adaptor subunit [Clostridiales bacterium]